MDFYNFTESVLISLPVWHGAGFSYPIGLGELGFKKYAIFLFIFKIENLYKFLHSVCILQAYVEFSAMFYSFAALGQLKTSPSPNFGSNYDDDECSKRTELYSYEEQGKTALRQPFSLLKIIQKCCFTFI